MTTETKDRLFVFLALALGFLFCEFILFEGFGISLPVYMILFYAAVFWYFRGKPEGFKPSGLLLLLPIGLLSAGFALYDDIVLSMLSFLLLYALIVFQLASMTGNRLYRIFSLGLVIDLFHAGVALPLANIPAPFRAFRRSTAANGKPSRLGPVFIGLAISVPILAVVLGLLAGADFVFEKSLNGILTFLNKHITEYVLKVIVGAIIAIPLFGLLYALRNNKRIEGLKFRINLDRVKAVDAGVGCTVLLLLNVVYLAFIAVQFGYLFNAFSSILPADFTYAEYARRGFFELMAVVVINLGVLSLSMLFSRRGGKGGALLRAMEAAQVLLTLLLAVSAMAKMVMYMDAYGLTLMRVCVAWFMVLCAVFFAAIFVKLFVKKFALVRFCFGAFIALFLLLNYADVDARIAQYNVESYRSGDLTKVDVSMLYDLSDSMVPYAAELLEDKDKAVAKQANELLCDRAKILNDNRWQIYSVANQNAKNILKQNGITYKPRPDDPAMD